MKDRKITVDDFKNDSTIAQMVDELGSIDNKDAEGFTPLCFSILNSIAPEIIVSLINGKEAVPSTSSVHWGSADTSIKSKGKTPMQTACTAMNVNAVKALIGEWIEFTVTDDNGNPKQAYIDCLPAYVKDEDGNDTSEPLPLTDKVHIKNPSKRYRITDADILSASLLSKEDILKAILEYKHMGIALHDIYDNNGNTPLHLACIAMCYGSVDLLYKYRKNNKSYNDAVLDCENDDDKTPLDIAEDSGDDTLVEKLNGYLIVEDISTLLAKAFARKQHAVINDILLHKRLIEDSIYTIYNNEYNWGSAPAPLKKIIKYIDEENNEDLYTLLLDGYNSSYYSEFKDEQYKSILAYLCYKGKSPISTLNNLCSNVTSYYSDVVRIMFYNNWTDIKDVCNLSETYRNNCVDRIFSSSDEFNNEAFIKLLECDSSNRWSVASGLYSSYFNFDDIISLVGYTADSNLFDLIYSIGVPSTISLNQIFSISDKDFKTGLIVYLYDHDNIVTLDDIEDNISDDDYKVSVIAELYYQKSVNLQLIITSSSLSNSTKLSVISKICEDDSALIDDIFEVAFRESSTSIIDHVIQSIVTSDTIYDWYDKSYYYGSSSGQMKAIAQYVDDKDDDILFGELLVDKFNKDVHLATFIRLHCSNIVAFLLGNENITLADICNTPEENTQSVINDLYSNDDISLQDLADLSETIGNEKLFDVFDAMIADNLVALSDILSEIPAGEFKDALLEHLHEEGTFNNAPVAVVEQSSFTASVGDVIELDASRSYDPDGDTISYIWSGEYSYLLSDIHISKPNFTVPYDLSSSITYLLTVTVTDNHGASNSASVTISVIVAENHAPVIVLADTFYGSQGNSIELDASGSYDPDSDEITFNWTGTYASLLDNPNSNKPRFTIPPTLSSTTTYALTLTVTDSHGISASKQITIIAVVQQNQAPVVIINSVFEGQPGDIIELDASSSYDPDNDPISYTWEGIYASQLVCINPAKPKFTIPSNAVIGSEYKFTARVTDNRGASSSKIVTVRVPSIIGTSLFTTGTFAAETEIPEAAEQLYNHYRERGLEIKENFNLIYDEDAIVTE